MKKMMKKTAAWLMVCCMIIGLMPVFGFAMAAEGKQVPTGGAMRLSAAAAAYPDDEGTPGDFSNLPSGNESKGWNSENIFGFLWDLLKAIGANLRALSVNDVLNLPANSMDDVVTYIFTLLKTIGLNLDSLYAMLSSILSFT